MAFDIQNAIRDAQMRGQSPFDVVLPNGKKLGDCTSNDLKKLAKAETALTKSSAIALKMVAVACDNKMKMLEMEARHRLA